MRAEPTGVFTLALLLTAAAAAAAAPGCAGSSAADDERVRADVQLLVLHDGDRPDEAVARVARHGRRALPAVESALHTAPPRGRKNLVLALRRIGDADAVPLLRHLALHDGAPDVRQEAEWTLRTWARETGPRADRARQALRELSERRAQEAAG